MLTLLSNVDLPSRRLFFPNLIDRNRSGWKLVLARNPADLVVPEVACMLDTRWVVQQEGQSSTPDKDFVG